MESCIINGNASTEEVAPKNMWGCLEVLTEAGTLRWSPEGGIGDSGEGRKEERKDSWEGGREVGRGGEEKEERSRKKRKERKPVAHMLARAGARSWER